MSTASKKANALNIFFLTCFNHSFPQLTRVDVPDLPPQDCPTEMLCAEVVAFNMLNALDTTKACGPDCITGKMLKMTASSITPVLTKLFNLSIAFLLPGKLPQLSLSPSVVLTLATDPSNYHPILLSPTTDIIPGILSSMV